MQLRHLMTDQNPTDPGMIMYRSARLDYLTAAPDEPHCQVLASTSKALHKAPAYTRSPTSRGVDSIGIS